MRAIVKVYQEGIEEAIYTEQHDFSGFHMVESEVSPAVVRLMCSGYSVDVEVTFEDPKIQEKWEEYQECLGR